MQLYVPTLELDQLEDHELAALVALGRFLVHSDGVVSNEEMLDLVSIGEVVGMERFRIAMDAASSVYAAAPAIVDLARSVDRYAAQVLIYVVLQEIAKGDELVDAEERILADVRSLWSL